MNVEWSDVGTIVNLLSILGGVAVVVLAAHLKKYFPGREEIAEKYVSKETFTEEMRKLRDDLHTQLANASQNTDRLLQQGIEGLRDQVNGMSPRIQAGHDKANSAESLASKAIDLLVRVETESGGVKGELQRLADNVSQMREDLGFIKGSIRANPLSRP